jgi:hypothetical protein
MLWWCMAVMLSAAGLLLAAVGLSMHRRSAVSCTMLLLLLSNTTMQPQVQCAAVC